MQSANPPVFSVEGLRALELQSEDIPELQRFFEENPEYFLAVEGRPPNEATASEEFHSDPPVGWSFSKKWLLGFVDDSTSLIGMASLVSDLLAAGVWHIGLFIVATARHGSGDAQALYRGVEAWTIQGGAQWLRLGVVEGNYRAERFWQSEGFVEVRKRHAVEMGTRVSTLRVMVKPLTGGAFAVYLEKMARDRPEC